MALLAGGDVAALLLFSAIGRFSHGFSVFDPDTLRTADPFVAGRGIVMLFFCFEFFFYVILNIKFEFLMMVVGLLGWFLSAYFLGGFGEDGRGKNGLFKAFIAATQSWSLGIPVSLL